AGPGTYACRGRIGEFVGQTDRFFYRGKATAMRSLFDRPDRSRDRARSRSRRLRFERMEERTLLSAVSWTGQAGDNNWDTPGNWSTANIPAAADDVTITIAATVKHSTSAVDSVHSLTSNQPITLSGGTISIAASSSIHNTLTMTGGTLSGTGDLTVSGLMTLT